MTHRPAQHRRSTGKTGDTVGRCCQRHAITGRVMTDWYPTRIHAELINNGCCRGINHRAIRGTVHRPLRRRTVSCASDNFPVQSGQLCAGIVRLVSHHNCNFRYACGTEYIAWYPENWGPGPRKGDRGIGECVWRVDDEDRNPFDRCGAVSENTCVFMPTAAQPRGGVPA